MAKATWIGEDVVLRIEPKIYGGKASGLKMTKTWSLLSIDEGDRQFRGNDGYDDVFGVQYSFDQFVPNHRGVWAGHVGVIRDNVHFLGFGTIESVTESLGVKERHRCPHCGRTGFKARETMNPKFRCSDCKGEFDVTRVEIVDDARLYVAKFGADWTVLAQPLSVKENADLYLRNALQHAIRELRSELWVQRSAGSSGA